MTTKWINDDDDDVVMNDSEDEGFDENDYMSDEEDNEMLDTEVLKRLEEMEDFDLGWWVCIDMLPPYSHSPDLPPPK